MNTNLDRVALFGLCLIMLVLAGVAAGHAWGASVGATIGCGILAVLAGLDASITEAAETITQAIRESKGKPDRS